MYRIRWRGWGPEWDEWKSAQDLEHARRLVDEYEDRCKRWNEVGEGAEMVIGEEVEVGEGVEVEKGKAEAEVGEEVEELEHARDVVDEYEDRCKRWNKNIKLGDEVVVEEVLGGGGR